MHNSTSRTGNPIKNRHRRGSVSLLVVVVLTGVAVMALSVASVSVTSIKLARASQDKVTGLTLAEAGVDDVIAQRSTGSSVTTVTGTLYEDTANTIPIGTYSATISDVNTATGEKKIISNATNANGSTRKVVARVMQGTMQLGNAAIMSNGPVSVGGSAAIATTPSDQHVANVYGNGDVNLGGSGTVDGTLISAGNVTGTAYYPSVSGAPPYPFPDAATLVTMDSAWVTQAKATNNIINPSNLFNKQNTVTITAPAYISGSIQMNSSQTLNITGNGTVYVAGDIKMSANSTINNGSTLILSGTLSQQGQAVYQVSSVSNGTPTPTLVASNGELDINGGANNLQWGVIYSLRNGIKVSGNATFTGALVSGGSGYSVTTTGTYNQYFPTNMASAVSIPAIPVVTHVEEF